MLSAVLLVVLVVVAVFATVELRRNWNTSDLAEVVRPSGEQSAQRMRTLLASGDLDTPAGSLPKMRLGCSPGSGWPTLFLDYGALDFRDPTNPLFAQLRQRGWVSEKAPLGFWYKKDFHDWTATLALSVPPAEYTGPVRARANLTVTRLLASRESCLELEHELTAVVDQTGVQRPMHGKDGRPRTPKSASTQSPGSEPAQGAGQGQRD